MAFGTNTFAETSFAGDLPLPPHMTVSLTGMSAIFLTGAYDLRADCVLDLTGLSFDALTGNFVASGFAEVHLTGLNSFFLTGDPLETVVQYTITGVKGTLIYGDFVVDPKLTVTLTGQSIITDTGVFTPQASALVDMSGISSIYNTDDFNVQVFCSVSIDSTNTFGVFNIGDYRLKVDASIKMTGDAMKGNLSNIAWINAPTAAADPYTNEWTVTAAP